MVAYDKGFRGFCVSCEGGLFWWWVVWSSVEGHACGGFDVLNPSTERRATKDYL